MSTVVTGIDHLEGETVSILADGELQDDQVVTNGTVTLTGTVSNYHIGLKFISKLLSMKIDGEVHSKRISRLIPQLFETAGGEFGETLTTLDDIPYEDTDLFTGHKVVPFDGSYNRQGDFWLQQDKPLPMTLIGTAVKLEVTNG